MKELKMYANEVVHVDWGIRSMIGRIDTSEHPMGENWVRILDPCDVFTAEKDGRYATHLQPVDYPQKNYRKHVDVRIPSDAVLEIRTLDKNGERYKVYKKVMNLPRTNLIQTPGSGDVVQFSKGQ